MSSINSDLTFITNDENSSLKERFQTLIKDTAFFDCLVGYFYTTGFHLLYKSLEKTEKIRILIGIGTGRETIELINQTKSKEENSSDETSFKEASEIFIENVKQEMENSEDKKEVEE
jgi:hypothetical protein